ncbi:MAG: hypothetical protein K0S09_1412 [Sphingobacteriaceae bacterium]|jgi:hypothetical protein|nr:hypothetical protein [Sphingobacteriaceae bacterium]
MRKALSMAINDYAPGASIGYVNDATNIGDRLKERGYIPHQTY